MRQIVKGLIFINIIVALIVISFTVRQVSQEEKQLTSDIQYRSTLLSQSLKEKIESSIINKTPPEDIQNTIDSFYKKERLAGINIFDNKSQKLATSPGVLKNTSKSSKVVARAMDEDKAASDFITANGNKFYVFALPLHDEDSVIGALMIVQNANYIDEQIIDIWKNSIIRIFIQIIALSTVIVLVMLWLIYEPVKNLVEAIKLARLGKLNMDSPQIQGNIFLRPLAKELVHITKSLFEARRSASEEARLRLEKLDSPWTAQRLQEFVKAILKGRMIFVVSNREPYIHTKDGNKITYYKPASGMVTAVEPMMKSYGGIWVAQGSGNADKEVVDKNDKLQVPPDEPKYTLKRIWLSKEEEKGFYYGFANEGIWPLCHMAHTRPTFRKEDWHEYQKVNGKFAQSILQEIKNVHKPIILVQDFHFALLPKMIKDSRPDALICIFWHIPWPTAEAFSICPWRKEILDGMLGADLLGFHTQLHCNNFIDTVGNELESLINREQFVITRLDHKSYIKSFPISIPFSDADGELRDVSDEEKKKILKKIGVVSKYVGLGVDRLDYTKGITERLRAVELFLTKYPYFKENFTFIQIAAPSRSTIPEYQKIAREVEDLTNLINKKLSINNWKPIILLEKHHSHEEIYKYYQMANVCLVTSLHDGMNLVAKEYVWSRRDEQGVLILSQFTGASKELKESFVINPYDIEEMAEAIRQGLTMMPSEQKMRMSKMRQQIKNNNVYRWSADLLKTLVSLEQ